MRRLPVAAAIMVAADVAGVYSMAAHVAWGWHLLGLALVFAVLAWWVRRELPLAGLGTIVLITTAVQLTGLLTFPLTSDDIYRYVWDGRVQLAGIDPYRYPPLDPALSWLRDPTLFPPGQRPLINRPAVPTIYPPGAQAYFAIMGLLTPAGWTQTALRVAAGAAVVGTTIVLARSLGPQRGRALIYGANPLVMIETTNGGHLDALVALAVAGLAWCAVRRRHWLAGVCLGLAASLKLVPLLLFPIFLRRGRWRTSLTAFGITIGGYLPHLVVVGSLVLGYLPGYLSEEGYGGSGRFALLAWLPVQLRTPVALALALLLAVIAFLRSAREPVLRTCVWLYGTSFLIATPVYPWYALPLLVLAVLARRWEWIAVWAAAYVAFVFDHSVAAQAAAYGAAAVVVVIITALRRGPSSSRKVQSGGVPADLTV
ncbi:glycosyltransferase family 87 protein [Microlunatus ginsengisoli]|uniref:DUF2029 domain-containing protein n=1 Tax=Microlunatus ginsengisoli TaxID=363863 RepID=A0ABP6ZM11_9ACTN